jgi:hypothetical protein
MDDHPRRAAAEAMSRIALLLLALALPAAATGVAPDSTLRLGRAQLSGTFEAETRWMRHLQIARRGSRSASDLYIRRTELGIEAGVVQWASVLAVLNSEWIGDPVNRGDQRIALDEAHLELRAPGTPLIFVFGTRTQPFGLLDRKSVV